MIRTGKWTLTGGDGRRRGVDGAHDGQACMRFGPGAINLRSPRPTDTVPPRIPRQAGRTRPPAAVATRIRCRRVDGGS